MLDAGGAQSDVVPRIGLFDAGVVCNPKTCSTRLVFHCRHDIAIGTDELDSVGEALRPPVPPAARTTNLPAPLLMQQPTQNYSCELPEPSGPAPKQDVIPFPTVKSIHSTLTRKRIIAVAAE